jgi:RNA polymerase sigma factor (sigma-70 family)
MAVGAHSKRDHFTEDSALLRRWIRGDAHAAEQLILREIPGLIRYFRCVQPADADDLMQDTLLAMLEARDRFRGEASFRTFLFRIARYTLWSHRRKQQVSHELLSEGETGAAVAPVVDDGLPTCDALDEALKSLSPALSRVVDLILDRRLTREAIASELGIPAGTVASRIRLAKSRLRDILTEQERELAPQRARGS